MQQISELNQFSLNRPAKMEKNRGTQFCKRQLRCSTGNVILKTCISGAGSSYLIDFCEKKQVRKFFTLVTLIVISIQTSLKHETSKKRFFVLTSGDIELFLVFLLPCVIFCYNVYYNISPAICNILYRKLNNCLS